MQKLEKTDNFDKSEIPFGRKPFWETLKCRMQKMKKARLPEVNLAGRKQRFVKMRFWKR